MARSKPQNVPKPVHSSVGAPSQLNQGSRKGKRAWRKNVDIQDVEEGLEGLRAEERVTGTILQKTKDSDLFQIDVTGDERTRKALPRFSSSLLTSAKILAQRSAIPAIFSRPATSTKRKPQISREDKERLLRIAKRPRRGPFNSIMDPSEYEAGSGMVELSEAVKNSGGYDAWEEEQGEEELKDGMETVQVKKYKPPVLAHPKDVIDVPAIVHPHQGTSYNPPAAAHQELLMEAYSAEERRIREAEKHADVKAKMISAVHTDDDSGGFVAAGMSVDVAVDEEGEDFEEPEIDPVTKKMPERKTRAQRNKAAKQLALKRALADRAAQKRMHAAISTVKVLRHATDQTISLQESARAARRAALQERLRRGMAGQRLGKHKVPEGTVDVQLGEELSESLRALKPEGNLFRDRFLSLQQRALIEPRVPVLPKKRRNKIIEYEKHAWKRFE